MELSVTIQSTYSLQSLSNRWECFSTLIGSSVDACLGDPLYTWITSEDSRWLGSKQRLLILPVIFIGKTGYGKSSLLNCLVGHDIFPTDDVGSCTKKIDAACYQMGISCRDQLVFCDLPGVGENEQADQQYMEWYEGMTKRAAAIVYVLRADQRDFSVDEKAFDRLFTGRESKEKVRIALNCADKIEPISRGTSLSNAQMAALQEKKRVISELFSISQDHIFPCCAHTGYGLASLLQSIVPLIKAKTVK